MTRALAPLLALLPLGGCLIVQFPTMGQDPAPPSDSVSYEVFALAYATGARVPRSSLAVGASKKERVEPTYYSWLLRGGGHVVIVDPGVLEDDTRDELPLPSYTRPDEVLSRLGVAPGDVTEVILTNLEPHSLEAVSLYPEADFYVQSTEYNIRRHHTWRRKDLTQVTSPTGLAFLEAADADGRLVLVDTTWEVMDGLKLYNDDLVNRWGMYVGVNTEAGTVILGSEHVPLFESVRKDRRPRKTNARDAEATYANMRHLAPGRVIPSRDPEVTERYTAMAEGVYDLLAPVD